MTIELNENSFDKEVLQSDKLVIVDFWAPWCGPCRMLSPIIDEIATEYADKVKVCKLNTDENIDLSAKFQITSIPALIFFKNGSQVEKIVGLRQKDELKKVIDETI
jgi:thioredoxin 1